MEALASRGRIAFGETVESRGEIMAAKEVGCETPPFCVKIREVRGVAVAGVFGEIDLATIERLRDGLHEAARLTDESGRVVADLRGVEFIEVMGLKTLFEEAERLLSRGGELCLVLSQTGQVSHVIELAELKEAFVLYEDLALATGSG